MLLIREGCSEWCCGLQELQAWVLESLSCATQSTWARRS
jgi:hypothetical protein